MTITIASLPGLRDELFHVAEDLRTALDVHEYRQALEKNRSIWCRLRALAEAGHPFTARLTRERLLAKAEWVRGVYQADGPLSDQVVESLIILNLQTYVHLRDLISD